MTQLFSAQGQSFGWNQLGVTPMLGVNDVASEVFTRERANVTATHTITRDMLARMRFTLEIATLDQLQRVLAMVREVKGVMRAARR